jgi:hypothetical protein
MVDWTGELHQDRVADGTRERYVYSGREIHLGRGLEDRTDGRKGLKLRGFGIKRKPTAGSWSAVHYYFLGDPHNDGAYTSDTSAFYENLLRAIATRWTNGGAPPGGKVAGPGAVEAHYRGTVMWGATD